MANIGIGLVGRKVGMTRVYTEDGNSTPVTVINLLPNTVVALKTVERDGYSSAQMTTDQVKRQSKISKAVLGNYKKANLSAGRGLWEFRSRADLSALKTGDNYGADLFIKGQKVDVSGCSKGKGFQSGIRRWNFHTQDNSHGNSLSHRSNGSIGQCQTPGRVWKGKKMSGQQGNKRVTVQGLEVFNIDVENSALLIKGAVPGPNGGDVLIRPSVKAALPDIDMNTQNSDAANTTATTAQVAQASQSADNAKT